jgi:acyl transferase domain-containing protein
MDDTASRAIAIVGVGAILPDAPDAKTFWSNVQGGRYSITDVTPDRWDPALYYDPDPHAPDKTYSKIGGWVRDAPWDPMAWRLPVPPKVAEAMDGGQKWAIACTRDALLDYGWPGRALDGERTAVILGNAMAGELHYYTALRIFRPEVAAALATAPHFGSLPSDVQQAIDVELGAAFAREFPAITEDTMPGELANCIAGRIANLFDFHGPNFIVDAACASAMAAMSAAVEGLVQGDFDAAVTGGIDRNMGVNAYVKFCKIGALSATGTRPYADGADGFVMGEGAVIFVLKRLADAERNGDHVYAVLRGIGGASDGKGKGITAPNPVGQRLAIERAWRNAALSPATAGLIEGHGTSTRVGDVVEVGSLSEAFAGLDLGTGTIALGSVKSNIGHLKGAAGAAGVLKAALALRDKVLPPSLHCETPNPNIDFARSPFAVNRALRDWPAAAHGVRRAGVSAFGFGGTNFHLVLEEFVPGRLETRARVAVSRPAAEAGKAPLRGALVAGASDRAGLTARLEAIQRDAQAGRAPRIAAPAEVDLRAPERIAIDYRDAADLADKAAKALRALSGDDPALWKVLRPQGIFRGRGPAPRVAFLYPGQGSQYVGMLGELRAAEPVVAEVFAEADRAMTPLLGRPLPSYLFPDARDPAAIAQAEEDLKQTEITQPAVLATDWALTRLLAAYGITPDVVMGHSLGEYGALVAASALPFADALEAVSARGREMASVSVEDPGWMAAVMAPLHEVERIVRTVGNGVVIANINSTSQAVIGGPTRAVEDAIQLATRSGYTAVRLPVSHAFHTAIVAPASEPLRRVLARLRLETPVLPVIANVTGELYPTGHDREALLDLLARQVASPVQFVKGLETLYAAGVRLFVEVGPKRALTGFVDDVLGEHGDVVALLTNHPKTGDVASFNHALCGLWAAGLGAGVAEEPARTPRPAEPPPPARPAPPPPSVAPVAAVAAAPAAPADRYAELGRLFADFVERAGRLWAGGAPATQAPVVITGAALGLPGVARVFDDANLGSLLRGTQLIDAIPTRLRRAMLDKRITRLVKSDGGGAAFETIDSPADVIKLAARAGAFDLAVEFGVPSERLPALDVTTRLAIGAGLDALRDAGIPLVLHYTTTHKGTRLPDRWMLPDALRDDTGVLFASAFPGYDAFADDLEHFHRDRARREQLELLESLQATLGAGASDEARREIGRRRDELQAALAREPYTFDRRFLFRILSMGHSQLAELIGARGPNTQVNAACASTTQAIAIAEDWIRAGRCRRVLIVAADDVTSDHLLEWIGAGFLASGAAATDDVVEEAALPFDRRRHGMLLGMGAAAIVVEGAETARERGVAPIGEVLGSITANSAFHGTRLDVAHIARMMEAVVRQAEERGAVSRAAMAPELLFVSHETYTPARGGSASAEVHALRSVFGADADRIVIANTKGFTGHPMGVGIEDVVAVKALETGLVPPVANFREVDPELGPLNLSHGGEYPVRYALRLGAGFGSQISMTLVRWTPPPDGRRHAPEALGYATRIADPATWQAWLDRIGGQAGTAVEVVQRTLRVRDTGPAATMATRAAAAAPAPEVVSQPAAEPAAAPAAADPVQARVLGIVAEKTGYPEDMLDLDLDLEADLGIDTVKQAETFAAVRQAYDIPRDDKLRLRDFPTLAHVVQFVRDRRPDLAPGAPAAAAPAAAPPSAAAVARASTAPTSVPRRVPVPALRPPLARCLPTGVTLGSGSRIIVMADSGGVAAALVRQLDSLGVTTLVIDDAPGVDDLLERLAAFRQDGPPQGVYWLPALDVEPALADLNAVEWREGLRRRVKLLAAALRALYDDLGAADRFLVCGTRLGGRHGYDPAGATAPLGGAVTGFAKAFKRERPSTLVKLVDVASDAAPDEVAEHLVAESLRDPGAVEVGYADGLRWTVTLHEAPAADGQPGLMLGPDTVFVVTGAAGSIVAAITADLAASGGTFHLLDLVPEPDPTNPDLARLTTDRDALKRDLAERMRARGERPTPAAIERQLAGLERAASALQAMTAVRAAGGTAHWHQVDLRDGDAVAQALAGVPRVDVLMHAAGLEVSHFLPDKTPAEFDLVFDVKADGWFHLLHALAGVPLAATVVFSSIAGRFGNGGQTDYSAANDLLCKTTSALRRQRPDTRAIAIDWTAWSGIGMAARGSIPRMMEAAGIDMLAPEAGIPVVRRELTAGGTRGEVVIATRLGILEDEWEAAGGLEPAPVEAQQQGPMVGRVLAMRLRDGLVAETRLDPTAQPFLHDHQIDGTPVLPGVMGIEAFAEVATVLLPGWHVVSVDDVDFLAPVKFYRGQPRDLVVTAVLRQDAGDIVAECRLIGSRILAGQSEPRTTVHFTGRVRLARTAGSGETMTPPPAANGSAIEAPEIYATYFHGPAYRVLERAWHDGSGTVGQLATALAAHQAPAGAPLRMAPRLIELCFQTAGIRDLQAGRLALPHHVDRVRVASDLDAAAPPLRALVVRRADGTAADAAVIDARGRVIVKLEGYRTVESPSGAGAEPPAAVGATD